MAIDPGRAEIECFYLLSPTRQTIAQRPVVGQFEMSGVLIEPAEIFWLTYRCQPL